MKIDKKKMVTFLKKVNMEGENKIEEAMFDFGEKGLNVKTYSSTNVVMVDALLKKEAFEEYEAFGRVGVQYISKVIRVFDSFDKTLDISLNESMMIIKEDKKSVDFTLFVDDEEPIPSKPHTFDEEFMVSNIGVKSFISDVLLNDDYVIRLETKPETLIMKNTKGNFRFVREFNLSEVKGVRKDKDAEGNEVEVKGVITNFGKPIVEAIVNLTKDFYFGFSHNSYIRIREVTDDSTVELFVAPRLDDDATINVSNE